MAAGSNIDEIFWNDMPVKAIYEYRQKNFSNAPDRPLSRGLNGADSLVSLSSDQADQSQTRR